jgi:hypothetical protein
MLQQLGNKELHLISQSPAIAARPRSNLWHVQAAAVHQATRACPEKPCFFILALAGAPCRVKEQQGGAEQGFPPWTQCLCAEHPPLSSQPWV